MIAADTEIVRYARESDVARIVDLGRRFLLEGPYRDQLLDRPEEATQFAANVMANEKGHILVAEKDGQVIGVIAFIVMPHWFSGEMTATEMIWYVEPEHRPGGIAMKLMWEMERRAKELGAIWSNFTSPYGQPVEGLYKRAGYVPVETSHRKRLR